MRKRLFLVAVVCILLPWLLAGCGVAQEKYDTVVADRDKAQQELQSVKADYTKLTADDSAVKQQLSDIKKVYPARYFSSLNDLRDWLHGNDISERPSVNTAEDLYAKALDLQESAMKDGYIISAFIEHLEENNFLVGCKAVIDGNIYSWDVETDEPVDWSGMYNLLRVK